MLTAKEYGFLNKTAILDKVKDRTGMSEEEILGWKLEKIQKTLEAMATRGILIPEIGQVKGVKEIESGPISRAYRAVRLLKGKGVNQDFKVSYLVFSEVSLEEDDRLWHHCSVTRSDKRMPTHDDLTWMKRIWMNGRLAIEVFPV